MAFFVWQARAAGMKSKPALPDVPLVFHKPVFTGKHGADQTTFNSGYRHKFT